MLRSTKGRASRSKRRRARRSIQEGWRRHSTRARGRPRGGERERAGRGPGQPMKWERAVQSPKSTKGVQEKTHMDLEEERCTLSSQVGRQCAEELDRSTAQAPKGRRQR